MPEVTEGRDWELFRDGFMAGAEMQARLLDRSVKDRLSAYPEDVQAIFTGVLEALGLIELDTVVVEGADASGEWANRGEGA